MKKILVALLLLASGYTFAQTTTNVNTTNNTTTTNTTTSTNTNTNVNTNNNIQSGTVTNNNNNVNTSTNTNTNYNVQSGTATNINNNNNVSTSNSTVNATNINTNNNNSVSSVTSTNTNNNNNVSTSTATNTNINKSDSTSVNTNNNTNNTVSDNKNLNVNQSTSTSESKVETTNTNINRNENITKVEQDIKSPPASAIAPMISTYSQDVCVSGVSGAVQTQVVGLSAGKSVRDMNCERLKLSKTLYDMGMKVAAVSLMCQDERVFKAMEMAGTPCPYMGKIGKEANEQWSENVEERPDYSKKLSDRFTFKLPKISNLFKKEVKSDELAPVTEEAKEPANAVE